MEYKYKRGQFFGKRLKVPKMVLQLIYDCKLSFIDFIDYNLDDKIPISCLKESDRKIVEKFGIEKAKTLDWELLNRNIYSSDVDFKEVLMSIDSSVENLNYSLYELVKDIIPPQNYPSKMKDIYSDRLFVIDEKEIGSLAVIKRQFNSGRLDLRNIVNYWHIFKDKDLSFCLQNQDKQIKITDQQLKFFLNDLGELIYFLDKNNIEETIIEYNTLPDEKSRHNYIKQITDSVLEKIKNGQINLETSNNLYEKLFEYSSLEEYLISFNNYKGKSVVEELKYLPKDYIFNIPIPFEMLCNWDVLNFVGEYGLKNVVDFDNECGNFFTKNNCEMLKLMNDMFLHYAVNEHDEDKNIYMTSSSERYSSKGEYLGRQYTKDEFYESMRRMIVYGPSDWNYVNKAPDYRNMTGEFRTRNAELFISEQAPEELQKLFYTKSITPQLLVEHPEFIQYLRGKDLSSCLKNREIRVGGSNALYGYENLYSFISSKIDFDNVMNFITEYSDVLETVFNRNISSDYLYEMNFSINDNINDIQKTINDFFKKLIIEKRLVYPKTISQNLITNYPSMFLNPEAPEELQEAFYNRTINSDFILSNPTYRNYLNNVDLEVIYKYMPVSIKKIGDRYAQVNLISAINQTFGKEDSFDVMLLYGQYIERVYEANQLRNFQYDSRFSKDDLLDELDTSIFHAIVDGKIKYDESIPSHFKNNNPTLFLNENLPKDIRDKFYNREFTLNDFNLNPDLLEFFGNTNIACGFPENIAWIIPLFDNFDNLKTANYNRLKVISAYSRIQDVELQRAFKEYVMEFEKNIEIEKIEYVSVVLSRLALSNSNEIFTFRKELATQILKSSNPLESLNKIEDVFIKNNIPTIGKIYSCFEILHPDFIGFDFNNSMVSPVLKKASTRSKKIIVFSDLIKASFGSNNRTINSYLKNIEIGSKLYESINNGYTKFENLNDMEQDELTTFSKHLITLYNNTTQEKKEEFLSTGNVLTDIFELSKKLSPDGTLDYDLADRTIRMFCGFAGIDTLEQAKDYIRKKIQTADMRNRSAASMEMKLEKGDFIKGIGDIKYLRNILQNGSVSKEYLGSSAGSDATPLDTDISMIMGSDGTTVDKINSTSAKGYGPIWFVLKNDERFITTRTNSETLDTNNDISKIEVFYTGVLGQGHYGIRTGFASSEINYIVMENYDPRVALEVVMNGFYIPIANQDGKILFTPNDYNKLREKMSGLSYFNDTNYIFSNNLITDDTEYLASQIEQSNSDTQVKRTKINEIIKDALDELGLSLKTTIDGDLTEGFVELIDTGSTGRGTNKPGDGDFDFMMRLDRNILSNEENLNKLKQTLLKRLGKENNAEITANGDFRLKSVQIDENTIVDIDITFCPKTDKITYSTDMALQDRLNNIKCLDPEKYNYVVANILLAKQVLKTGNVYKPNRGEIPQGGLGGVGIENWILQNGGSFIDAAKSFVAVAKGKTFDEFKKDYQLWDFGENHIADKNGKYPHDNFIECNMSEDGYKKMCVVLNQFIQDYEFNQNESQNKR